MMALESIFIPCQSPSDHSMIYWSPNEQLFAGKMSPWAHRMFLVEDYIKPFLVTRITYLAMRLSLCGDTTNNLPLVTQLYFPPQPS